MRGRKNQGLGDIRFLSFFIDFCAHWDPKGLPIGALSGGLGAATFRKMLPWAASRPNKTCFLTPPAKKSRSLGDRGLDLEPFGTNFGIWNVNVYSIV